MKWIIGLLLGGGVAFIVWRKVVNRETPADITQGLTNDVPQGPRPTVSPGTPSPTLCEGLTTIGGVAVATYYGVPPQVSIPLSTAGSRPICAMGAKALPSIIAAGKGAGNFVGTSVKGTLYETPKAGVTETLNQLSESWKRTEALASAVKSGSPTAVGKASVDLTVQTISAPIKIVTTTLKKADPRNWF